MRWVRQLQRRVGKTLPSVYDRLLSVDSESAGRTGLYIPPTAQEVIGRVETVNSVGSSMDLDSSVSSLHLFFLI
jgi:exosome complex RNA-binding protein Rrp4